MPAIGTEELLSRLKKGKPVPAILLLGDEPYLRDTCRAQLIDQYVPEAARTWAVSRFSAERGDMQAAIDQAQTMPMLSPQQVVFLEDAEAIEKLAEKKREEAVKQPRSVSRRSGAFTVLVVEAAHLGSAHEIGEAAGGENVGGRSAVSARTRPSETPLRRVSRRSVPKNREWNSKKVRPRIWPSASLPTCSGLKTEIEKLSTFVGDAETDSPRRCRANGDFRGAGTVWEMADFMLARRAKQALDFLDRLLREGEEPLPMLGAMAWMYRKLMEASEVKGAVNGWQAARALRMLRKKPSCREKRAKDFKTTLLAGLQAFQRADDLLKGGTDDSPRVDGISDYRADFAGSKCCKRPSAIGHDAKKRTRVRPFLLPNSCMKPMNQDFTSRPSL